MKVIEGRLCDVYPSNESHYSSINNIQLINGMFTTYTTLGEIIVVELNNALDFTDILEYGWLCTNQTRENGVDINEIIIKNKKSSSFDVNFVEEGISILLQMNKPTSYILMRHSTDEDFNECRHVVLISYNECNQYNNEMDLSFPKSGQILCCP